MASYKSCKTPGIRYAEHETRKHGRQKDKYFVIRYSKSHKQVEEGLGWASKGWSEQKANEILSEIKENIRRGIRPQSFKEKREMAEQAQKAKEQKKIETEAEWITFSEVFERYLPVHKTETTKKTWQNTERYYRNWISSFLGDSKIIDITVDDIQKVVSKAIESRSPRTADFVKTVIRQIFNFAKSRDLYFKDNPAMKIKVKQVDNKRSRFLTREEAQALLRELEKHSQDVHDIALFSLLEGARAGSIFALQWKDVDFNINRLSLLDTKNGQCYFQPIHPIVKEMLQRRFKNDSEGYVFKSRTGRKIEDLSDTYQRVVDKMGFNDGISDPRQRVVFHTLRHTYASWLVMDGVDLYTTQKLMGHKSNQMTQRYAHLAPGHLEKAVCSLRF